MRCLTLKLPDGNRAIVCGNFPKGRTQYCRCGAKAELQCDFPKPIGKTCDRHLCRRCAVSLAEEVDICPHHPMMSELPAQGDLLL